MRRTPTFLTRLVLIFWTPILIPLLLLSLVGMRSIRYYMSRWWAWRILWAAGVKIEVEGTEQIEAGGGPLSSFPTTRVLWTSPS